MIYTLLTKKALELAYNAHHGQFDKSGMPYIFHPYHLAEQMADEITTCVALLHDVVEDTEITFEDLQQDFPKEVIDALRLLTHTDGVDYFEYVKNIRQNHVAKTVKLADIDHNSDESRLIGCAEITDEQRAYLRVKYVKAKRYLSMIIRQEAVSDYEEIYKLVKDAFETAEHADGNEQDLVAALKKGESFIPELSLVAEIDGKTVGYILFSKAKVGNREVLVLAPLAVKPAYQKLGIGAELINEGHRIAKEQGYEYSIVLGSEKYYPRFGYVPAVEMGVDLPEGFPSENFMAIRLQENAEVLNGSITYAKEFGI